MANAHTDEAEHDRSEALQSINARIADIGRWILLAALKGSIGSDRKRDIIRAAQDIVKLAERL